MRDERRYWIVTSNIFLIHRCVLRVREIAIEVLKKSSGLSS